MPRQCYILVAQLKNSVAPGHWATDFASSAMGHISHLFGKGF